MSDTTLGPGTMQHDINAIDQNTDERAVWEMSDIYKYADRINDKLSSFNNLLIIGYFFTVTFNPEIYKWVLVVPFVNMAILMYLDYRMIEQASFIVQAKSRNQIEGYRKNQRYATILSLLTIMTTFIVTVVFLLVVHRVIDHKVIHG